MISSEVIHSFLHTRKSKIKSWFIINWRQSVVIKRNRLLIHVNSQDFSSGHVWMWELDCEESWALKNWCFWTVVLEKTLESPLNFEEIQPVHPKGDQSWVFFGRTNAKAEIQILWPPHVKSWLTKKDSDGRDWGQEEKGTTEDEMAGWHHRFNGREFEWTPGVGDGQGGRECCDSWGCKESDTTEWLNWTELNWGWSMLFFQGASIF